MKPNAFNQRKSFLPGHRHGKWRQKIVSALGCAIAFCMAYTLILPAAAVENSSQALVCSRSTHKHAEDCYDESGVLICDQPEHQHSAECLAAPPAKETGDSSAQGSETDSEDSSAQGSETDSESSSAQGSETDSEGSSAQDKETDAEAPTEGAGAPEDAGGSAKESESSSEAASEHVSAPETGGGEKAAVCNLTASADNVKVTAVFAQGILPEDAVLKIVSVPASDREASKYDACLEQHAGKKGMAVTGSVYYDISFTDAEGNMLKPRGMVTVTMDFTQRLESAEADGESNDGKKPQKADQDIVWSVVHILDGKTVEELSKKDTTKIKTDDRNRVSSVTFENDSFSPYGIVSYREEKDDGDKPADPADRKEPVVQVDVKTKWEEGSETLPDTITADLLRRADGEEKTEVVYSQKLSGENSWSHSWTDLPQKDDTGREYIYSVQEQTVDGFETTYRCDADTAEDGSKSMVYTIINTPVVYSLQVLKVSSEDESIVLQGAEFSLKAKDASKALNFIEQKSGVYTYTEKREGATAKLVTGEDGTLTVTGLREGVYILEEREAPAGYEKMAEPVSVTVTEEEAGKDKTVKLTVEGTPMAYTLPATGGGGVDWLIYSGVLLMGIAALGYIFLFLKKTERGNRETSE